MDDEEKIQYDFCKDSSWKLKPSSELFVQIYLIHKLIPDIPSPVILLDGPEKYEGEIYCI